MSSPSVIVGIDQGTTGTTVLITRDDFARLHPAGNLGIVLLLKVQDIMRTGDRLPVLPDTRSVQDAILGASSLGDVRGHAGHRALRQLHRLHAGLPHAGHHRPVPPRRPPRGRARPTAPSAALR